MCIHRIPIRDFIFCGLYASKHTVSAYHICLIVNHNDWNPLPTAHNNENHVSIFANTFIAHYNHHLKTYDSVLQLNRRFPGAASRFDTVLLVTVAVVTATSLRQLHATIGAGVAQSV
jgi:hypothetical protein